MKEQSHTRGPWAVAEMDRLLGTEFIPIEGADGFRIAEVLGADDPNVVSPQDAANARLIAAAPELLEALQGLLAKAEASRHHLQATESGMLVGSALFDTILQARSAIAKALGVSNDA